MTAHLQNSMFGILSWMKEHQAVVSTPLDEITARFDVPRDHMQSQLQSLQRYECVKRGGRDNAGWSITDQGLVRLADGRFSSTGAFLSPYEPMRRSSEPTPDPARPVTMITVPIASERKTLDTQAAVPSPNPTPYSDYLGRWERRTEAGGEAW